MAASLRRSVVSRPVVVDRIMMRSILFTIFDVCSL